MRFFNLFACPGFLLSGGLFAIMSVGAPAAAQAQCPGGGTLVFSGVAAVADKPFQAKETATIVTYGKEGSEHTVVARSNLFRDSKGNIRVERFYDGTDDPRMAEPSDIAVLKDCNTSISLLPSRRIAKISQHTFSPGKPGGPYCKERDPENLPDPGPSGRFEDLGRKIVDGVEVRGERTSHYSSPQAKASGATPVQMFEFWCSEVLDNVVETVTLDENPKRKITTAVREIVRLEPNSKLFEVPEGYAIKKVE